MRAPLLLPLALLASGCVPMVMHGNDVAADSVALPPPLPTLGTGRVLGEDRNAEIRIGGFANLGPGFSQSTGPNLVAPAAGPQVDGGIRIGKVLVGLGLIIGIVPANSAKPGQQTPLAEPFQFYGSVEGQMFGRDDFDIGWELDAYGQEGAFHFPASATICPSTNMETMLPDQSANVFTLQAGGGITPEFRLASHLRLITGLHLETSENTDVRESYIFFPSSDDTGRAIVATVRLGVEIPLGRGEPVSLMLDTYGSWGWPIIFPMYGARFATIVRF